MTSTRPSDRTERHRRWGVDYLRDNGIADWSDALSAYRAGALHGAELCANFLVREAALIAGPRVRQGVREAPAYVPSDAPALALLARQRMWRLPDVVLSELLAWMAGQRIVELRFDTPTPLELLAMQARGARVVSLLPPEADTGRHASALEFAVHDLCHLGKFYDPELHLEQVGFFAALLSAADTSPWCQMEAGLEPGWVGERDYVMADMNGSALFSLLSLKARLRAAVRRTRGRDADRAQTDREVSDRSELLYAALQLQGPLLEAARALTARGSATDSGAPRLREHFAHVGRVVVRSGLNAQRDLPRRGVDGGSTSAVQ